MATNNTYGYSSSTVTIDPSICSGTTTGWITDLYANNSAWGDSNISAGSIKVNWPTTPSWSFDPNFLEALGEALEKASEEKKNSPLDDVIKTEAWDAINNSKKARTLRVSGYINNGVEVRLLLKKKKRVSISL